jgi:hypothetical protein
MVYYIYLTWRPALEALEGARGPPSGAGAAGASAHEPSADDAAQLRAKLDEGGRAMLAVAARLRAGDCTRPL